jgi:hypothetical protein
MHIRNETFFRGRNDPDGHGKGETMDALKDVFAALLTAQMRRRQGKSEVLRGGWWVQKRKWGGATPPEPPESLTKKGGIFAPASSNIVATHSTTSVSAATAAPATLQSTAAAVSPALAAAVAATADSTIVTTGRPKSPENNTAVDPVAISAAMAAVATNTADGDNERSLKRMRPRRVPKSLCPSPIGAPPLLWDRNTVYMAIGKPGSEAGLQEIAADIDYIYVLNAVNHHLSVSRYKVNAAYLEFLESHTLPSSGKSEDWYILELKRTRWFDLFKPEDRAEALRVLWGVFSYLSRGPKTEPMDVSTPSGPAATDQESAAVQNGVKDDDSKMSD